MPARLHHRPLAGPLYLHTDACLREKDVTAGWALLTLTRLLARGTLHLPRAEPDNDLIRRDSTAAELWALARGVVLGLAASRSGEGVVIRCDSSSIVDAVSGRVELRPDYDRLVERAVEAVSHPSVRAVEWVPREQNGAAHGPAHWGGSHGQVRVRLTQDVTARKTRGMNADRLSRAAVLPFATLGELADIRPWPRERT